MIILNERLAELIGSIIGDGCIRHTAKQYYVEIVGDREKEKEYFNYLAKIVKEELNLISHIKIIGRGLRMKVYSKEFINYLIVKLELPYNKEKCLNVFIPSEILTIFY